MNFKALPESLRDFASNTVVKYFKDNYGYKKLVAEEQISKTVNFRPTLKGESKEDGTLICIEIMERLRFQEMHSSFVLDCRTEGLPVKFYIVLLKSDDNDPDYKANLAKAQKCSVGVFEMDEDGNCTKTTSPLSQSLAGLRTINLKDFPEKNRASVTAAMETFTQGNPAKGCQTVYEEIERLTRNIALKADKLGCWKATAAAPIRFDKDPWFNVAEFLITNLNFSHAKIKPLAKPLLNSIAGITPDRNETGHKPDTFAKLKTRDSKLKFRFENSIDLLLKLIHDSKKLNP